MVTLERKMTQGEIEEFLSKPNLARIGTLNSDGSPHVTPVWFLLEDGYVTFTTGKHSRKTRNLSRVARALIVFAFVWMRGTILTGVWSLMGMLFRWGI